MSFQAQNNTKRLEPKINGFYVLLGFIILISIIFLSIRSFNYLGFDISFASFLVLTCIATSSINIPLGTLNISARTIKQRFWGYSDFIFLNFLVPKNSINLKLNLGGAVIPLIVAFWTVLTSPNPLLLGGATILGILPVSYIAFRFSKVIPNGIVLPLFLLPMTGIFSGAMWSSLFQLSLNDMTIAIYAISTIGTLFGVDIFNIRNREAKTNENIEIGGRGALDAIFLAGIGALFVLSF